MKRGLVNTDPGLFMYSEEAPAVLNTIVARQARLYTFRVMCYDISDPTYNTMLRGVAVVSWAALNNMGHFTAFGRDADVYAHNTPSAMVNVTAGPKFAKDCADLDVAPSVGDDESHEAHHDDGTAEVVRGGHWGKARATPQPRWGRGPQTPGSRPPADRRPRRGRSPRLRGAPGHTLACSRGWGLNFPVGV